MPVDIVHWNPRRPILKGLIGRIIPIRRPVNNFGDLLGPEIVKRVALQNIDHASWERAHGRLLAVGSIMSLARPGDVAWGIGVNGKSLERNYELSSVSFRAARGPLTKIFVEKHGGNCPAIFGDPGLLVSRLWSQGELCGQECDVTIVPNLNDLSLYDLSDPRVLLPTSPLHVCLSRIKNSKFVIGSSLHGIVVAESFGIPARLIRSGKEPDFKYLDYYQGSGRVGFKAARSLTEALDMGGEPPPCWDPELLLSAFPYDLWDVKK